jgi:hypothetical protein
LSPTAKLHLFKRVNATCTTETTQFARSPLNGCFVSDLQHLVDGQHAQLRMHGHTQDGFDCMLHGTRVVQPVGLCEKWSESKPFVCKQFHGSNRVLKQGAQEE